MHERLCARFLCLASYALCLTSSSMCLTSPPYLVHTHTPSTPSTLILLPLMKVSFPLFFSNEHVIFLLALPFDASLDRTHHIRNRKFPGLFQGPAGQHDGPLPGGGTPRAGAAPQPVPRASAARRAEVRSEERGGQRAGQRGGSRQESFRETGTAVRVVCLLCCSSARYWFPFGSHLVLFRFCSRPRRSLKL